MLANVGLKNMLNQAYEMGLTTLEPTAENMRRFGLAVTLGGAEVTMADMAGAYSAFANGTFTIKSSGITTPANIVIPDIQCTNGIVHVIDRVLVP
jgi:membrane carboxypeptidase/penicillin-binding protein PbpC